VPLSAAELIEKLDRAIAAGISHSDTLGDCRRIFLEHVRDLVMEHGLPLPENLKHDACAMPYIFQELNYDDYDWSRRTGDFGHLTEIVDIDVMTWSGGRNRSDLTDEEFAEYNKFCFDAIKFRSRK
jgi:hypothetical protein